jgi:hypothetical protein
VLEIEQENRRCKKENGNCREAEHQVVVFSREHHFRCRASSETISKALKDPSATDGKNHPREEERSNGKRQRVLGISPFISYIEDKKDDDEIDNVVEHTKFRLKNLIYLYRLYTVIHHLSKTSPAIC